MVSTSVLPDGQVKACLTEKGVTACCYVSSFHLVQEKENQLREAINRTIELRQDTDS